MNHETFRGRGLGLAPIGGPELEINIGQPTKEFERTGDVNGVGRAKDMREHQALRTRAYLIRKAQRLVLVAQMCLEGSPQLIRRCRI